MLKINVSDALSQALAEPSRRAILENLRFGPMSVTDLVNGTALKQPNVSNHLAKMREQGIVRAERMGRKVFYSISMPVADVMLRLHEAATNTLLQDSAPVEQVPSNSIHPANGDRHSDLHSTPKPLAAKGRQRKEAASPDLRNEESAGTSDKVAEWRDAYFQFAMNGQESRAVSLVNAMLAERLDMETIYIEIFQATMNRIGKMYVRGETTEAHEHLASAVTEQMMAKVAQFYTPLTRVAHRALLGCGPGNFHTLGLRMLADGLKAQGWETLFLGANVPNASFVSMVASTNPDLIIVSCTMAEQFPAVNELISMLGAQRAEAAGQNRRIVVGGYYFSEHPERLNGLPVDFTASSLPEFLERVGKYFTLEAIGPG